MYERFTDRARNVMRLANKEAKRFHHEYIGTEHMLLGLIKEGAGVAANVLKKLGVDLNLVWQEVEKTVQTGPAGDRVILGRRPHTPRAKKVIEYSIEEARILGHNYIGTEHLLLGLFRERDGMAAQVLTNLGLEVEAVREQVIKLPERSSAARAGSYLGGILRRLLGRFGKRSPANRSETPTADEVGRNPANP